MSEAHRAVLDHLLFHKALMADEDGGQRFDRYLAMVQEIERGQHIAVRDPLEKSIAAAFELVFEAQLDPWAIDLGQFTKLYMDKVRADGAVNFVTAGKLVFMAWSILKMQSDHVLEAAIPPPPVPDDSGDLDFYGADAEGFNQAVLDHDRVPLHEAIRREGRRAVTLMELVDAFDEARVEAEAQLRLAALREAARGRMPANFREKVHGEDVSEDIGITWQRIEQFDGQAIPLHALTTGDAWDFASVFTAVLFLAKMGKVKLWQKAVPLGEIYIRRLAPVLGKGEVTALSGTRSEPADAPGVAA